ncbi:MAG: type VI secretion system baseplate subunit TssF, partial [Holosporales bacterium]|nr:type VI secretion system baseplate subunit TssF [Holosporales bacterium]
EFAKKHPQIAEKLDIKNGESTDPHTERIIESVAFMAAKLNKKIDGTEQSIAFYLLSALYPSLISQFPPCSIASFLNSGRVNVSNTIHISKGTNLFVDSKSRYSCLFKTLYDIDLYPIAINSVNLEKSTREADGWRIKININTLSVPIENLQIKDILFYINSEILENSLIIYESIFSNKKPAFIKINEKLVQIEPEEFAPCGFSDHESICPVSKYSNNVFQLFQEMLHFKQKFMFFKLKNIAKYVSCSLEKNIDKFEIIIDINLRNERLRNVNLNNALMINAVPIVNLFPVTSDPFRFTGTKSKYLLVPDQSKEKAIEIHSILDIHMIDSETKEDRIIQPYFPLAIDSDTNIVHDTYWTYSREPSNIRGLKGYDTYISFVDQNMNPFSSYSDVVYATTLCTNRFETREIPVFSKLEVDGIESGGYEAKVILKPTEPVSFIEKTSVLWGLISNLSATHISIANEINLFSSITKLIEIFSSGNKLKSEELLSSITRIKIDKIVRRFGKDAWRGFVKGIEFRAFIKDEYNSFFSFFFCCILNQYLSMRVNINSFIELKLFSEKTNELLAKWNPTSGRMDLL